MKVFIIAITFLTQSVALAAACSFKKGPVITSEEQSSRLNDKIEVVNFYPKIHDYAHHFPKSVRLSGQLQGACQDHGLSLTIYMRKSPWAVDGKLLKGSKAFKPRFLAKEAYKREKIKISPKNSYNITKVPHYSLYDNTKEKEFWYDQVKYVIKILSADGKVLAKKERVIDSPLHD